MRNKQCILLFNLNTYLGGGETLLIRFAQYLDQEGVCFRILTGNADSWISSEALAKGYICDQWPLTSDSLVYNQHEVAGATKHFRDLYMDYEELRVFTFCMRDLFNATQIFSSPVDMKVHFFHGIYHPDDYKYLSSFSILKNRYYKANRRYFTWLHQLDSILFMNSNGFHKSIPEKFRASEPILLPIPIEIDDDGFFKSGFTERKTIKVLCISRFATFKIGAVMGIIKVAGRRSDIQLTLVGYGPWEILIRFWLLIFRQKNVKIINTAGLDDLPVFIKNADIGYAQGTSILEMAKYALPVIVAPYSRKRDIFMRRFSSFGVFGQVVEGYEFGDMVRKPGDPKADIESLIDNIVSDYKSHSTQSRKSAEMYSSKLVFPEIYKSIVKASANNSNLVPYNVSPPVVKRFVRWLKN